MAGKGSGFEREVAKALSLWFSHGEDDSWIWRTAMSGGRSTVRAKQGKKTSGGAGDLTFTDARAAPLFELVTLELKRGYKNASPVELIDHTGNTKPGIFEQWVVQAIRSATQAMTPNWMLIHKRDKRQIMAYMNQGFYTLLKDDGLSGGITLARPVFHWKGKIRMENRANAFAKPVSIVALPFDQFLDLVNPESLGAEPCPKKNKTASSPSRSKTSKGSRNTK